ncbi:MAG TPA: Uma2 family endonuclease [Planctomycetota bacterium]|nr:Uma2 family endonuclease [Planctomycetota bacterium]
MTTAIPTSTRRRRWTYADYCKIPPDRYRHEIIDGRHFVSPAPSSYHQKLSLRLAGEFLELVERRGLGEVFPAPFDVHLGRGTVVQPDLVVVTAKNRSLVGETKLAGVPDLLVEILSPSRRDYDCRIKRRKYERAGVREYWIVDPEVPCVEQYVLRAGRYGLAVLRTESIRLRVLRRVEIDLKRVW